MKWGGVKRQYDAYNDAINKFKDDSEYMLFVDADEFLKVNVNDKSAFEIINEIFDKTPLASSIGINWMIYGSANRKQMPSGLVLENYLYHSSYKFEKNYHLKVIINPRRVIGFKNPHFVISSGKYITVTANTEHPLFVDGPMHEPDYSLLQINHYFCKSYEEFIIKRNKGKADDLTPRDLNEFYTHDKNDIYDHSMLIYAEKIKRLLYKSEK